MKLNVSQDNNSKLKINKIKMRSIINECIFINLFTFSL